MRINFDFVDLETFLAVKDTGSFHVAAERLNLSQPSVTRRIQKLEDALGSVLFDRSTRQVRPTLAAKHLQERAEEILDAARETRRAMRDESEAFAHQRLQTVTLATIPTVMSRLVAPALRRFCLSQPTARVRLLDLAANEVAEAVAQGEADFGISSVPLQEAATQFTPLFDEPIILALPQSHHFASEPEVSWDMLKDTTLILPAKGTGNRLLIDDALAKSRHSMRWTMEVKRSSTALALVAEGLGVAPLPRLSTRDACEFGVNWSILTAPSVSRPIGLVTRSSNALDRPAKVLWDALIEVEAALNSCNGPFLDLGE